MLTEREKRGCMALLSVVPQTDLLSLAQTVTKGLVTVKTRPEAVKAIVMYTEGPAELLKRRKLKRDYMFAYLSQEGHIVSIQSEKHILSQKIMQVWGSVPVKIVDLIDESSAEEDGGTNQAAVATNQAAINFEQELAKQFVTWFYQMLNSHHPASSELPTENFGPQHFYNDCKMRLLCASPSVSQETYDGSQIVSKRLLAFVREEQLKFNPNISEEGLRGMAEPHGLRVIIVCGTVHQVGSMVGIFEQQFGLARDPDMNQNWRIKFSNLKMGTSHMTKIPTLQTTSQMLAITS